MPSVIQKMVQAHREGQPEGMYSVCSANPFVLRAALQQAKADQSVLLVEATSNQVDQYGGYTGMTPDAFFKYVHKIASTEQFNPRNLILGGDHLGPNVWQQKPAAEAMALAKEQIAAYVSAGFTKIHLDASMALGGDKKDEELPLDSHLAAERSAELCEIAEKNAKQNTKPVYVIGTDVPIPGGAKDKHNNIRITPVKEVREIIEATKKAFNRKKLQDAWKRVVAIVAQPGVEFGDDTVFDYNREKAGGLKKEIETFAGLIYEAHSTDYQRPAGLRQMVEDHFALLKVGPWLTFALREALFSLNLIEKEFLLGKKHIMLSQLMDRVEQAMQAKPQYWDAHYRGTKMQQLFARKYSFSDRVRYYWPDTSVQTALSLLLKNLNENLIPLSLLSQYLPNQYQAVREGTIKNTPEELILSKIKEILTVYAVATRQNGKSKSQVITDSEAN